MSTVVELKNESVTLGEIGPHVKCNVMLQVARSKQQKQSPTLWLSGPPGCGKSEYMVKFCEEEGYGLSICYLSQMTIDQMSGMPMVKITDETKTDRFVPWSIPEIFNFENMRVKPKKDIKESIIILFLDDAHLPDKSIQKYCFQLLGEKTIHKHTLPSNVAILLAGNRREDKSGHQQTMAAISNRIRYLDLRYDMESWLTNYAYPVGLRYDIVSFLQNTDQCFYSTPLESAAWASPRSWTYAALELDQMEELATPNNPITIDQIYHITKGCVGPEYARKFREYVQLFAQWRADDILNGKRKVRAVKKDKKSADDIIIEDLNRIDQYALLSACVGSLLKYLKKNDMKQNQSLNDKIDIFRKDLIYPISKVNRPIVPMGLRVILAQEKLHKQTAITRKLLEDPEVVKLISKIIK